FVVVLKWGVLGALLGQLVGSGIGALPAHWIVVRRFRGASGPLAVWEHVRSALAFGLPVLPHILAMWVLNLSGRMVLLNLHSKEAAGVYSLAFTLGMLVHLGGISLISGFGPLYYARADEPAFRAELPRLLGRYVTVHTWTALCVACLSQDVLYLFIRRNADYHAAGPLVVWIAFGYWWFVTFYQLGFTVVEAKRQTRWSAALSVPAALVNLGLNHWMIPRYGALAASISTLVAFCLMAILTLILARRLADLPFPYVRIGIGVALACGFFLLVGRWSLPQAPMVSLLTKFGLLCVFGLLLAGTQGLTPQALVRWLRSIAPGGGRRAETA
ncbi:MAG: hypothetical protein FJ315_09345, partial [SAR202 cluster bacterium]|nr:hypothetical protein [SAR202 cluster bacterium]